MFLKLVPGNTCGGEQVRECRGRDRVGREEAEGVSGTREFWEMTS